ncbi:MAG: transcription initiation factor IIB [Candidatus Saliniplasma sp.]
MKDGYVKMENESQKKIEKIQHCPECSSEHISKDYHRGELLCENCGLVLDDEYIDDGPEWRAFDSKQKEKRARTGAPMNYLSHDKGLSTSISWKNKDAYGRTIPHKNRGQIYRVRKWHRRIRVSNATERNLATALRELDRLSSKMGLPRSIRETAAMIYRKAVEKNLIRGRSIETVIASSLYAGCRKCDVPRTLTEISDVAQADEKQIGRAYRFLSRELQLKLLPTRPENYIKRFCSKLGLGRNVINKGEEIIEKANELGLTSGKGPTGIAAASIYISSILEGEPRTQRAIAEVAGVTEVTIRNRYKEIAEEIGITIET